MQRWEFLNSSIKRWFWWLAATLPFLWGVGISILDVARVVCVLGIFMAVINRIRVNRERPAEKIEWLGDGYFRVFTFAVIFLSVGSFIAAIYRAQWGLDSAIFAQVVQRFYLHGDFLTSLNRWGYQNFLSDHFSPILAVPGFFAGILGPPQSLALFHCLALVAAALTLHSLCSPARFPYLLPALFFAFPTVRHQIGWGTQVEFLALPFVGMAFLALSRENLLLVFLAWVLAALCKETLSCYAVCFFAFAFTFDSMQGKKNRLWFWLFSAGAHFLWFFVYVKHHQWLFDLPYDHLNRIQLDVLLNYENLAAKALFFVLVFSIPLVTIKKVGLKTLTLSFVPVGCFFPMVLISGFSNMWSVYTHYAVMPLFICFCTIGFLRVRGVIQSWGGLESSRIQILVLLACFSFSGRRPSKNLYAVVRSQKIAIPNTLVRQPSPVAADYGLAALAMQKGIEHEWLRPKQAISSPPQPSYTWLLNQNKRSGLQHCEAGEQEISGRTPSSNPFWLLYCHNRIE